MKARCGGYALIRGFMRQSRLALASARFTLLFLILSLMAFATDQSSAAASDSLNLSGRRLAKDGSAYQTREALAARQYPFQSGPGFAVPQPYQPVWARIVAGTLSATTLLPGQDKPAP